MLFFQNADRQQSRPSGSLFEGVPFTASSRTNHGHWGWPGGLLPPLREASRFRCVPPGSLWMPESWAAPARLSSLQLPRASPSRQGEARLSAPPPQCLSAHQDLLTQEVCGGSREPAFLTSSQVIQRRCWSGESLEAHCSPGVFLSPFPISLTIMVLLRFKKTHDRCELPRSDRD